MLPHDDVSPKVYPANPGFLKIICFASKEWRCLLLTVLILTSIFTLTWFSQHFALETRRVVHYFLCSTMLLLFYAIYLFECWNSKTRMQLSNTLSLSEMKSKILQAVDHDPALWWMCFSYHYSHHRQHRCHCRPRYIQETVKDHSYQGRTTNPVTTRRLGAFNRVISAAKLHFITGSDTMQFGWSDKSPQADWTTERCAVRVTFSKEFMFSDEATRRQYESCKEKFAQTQDSKDKFMEIKEGFQLYNEVELSPTNLVIKKRPAVFRESTFLLVSLFLLSWPFRIYIYCCTAKMSFPFKKALQMPVSQQSSGNNFRPADGLRQFLDTDENAWKNNEARILENPHCWWKDPQVESESDSDGILSIDIRYQGPK